MRRMDEAMKKKDAAFPLPEGCCQGGDDRMGMSLLDYFAGQALVGFTAFIKGGWVGEMPSHMTDHAAHNCYALAEAMLAEKRRREAE